MSKKHTEQDRFFTHYADSLSGDKKAFSDNWFHGSKNDRISIQANEVYLQNMATNFPNEFIGNSVFADPPEENVSQPKHATLNASSFNPLNEKPNIDSITQEFSCETDSIELVDIPASHVNSQVFPIFIPAFKKRNSETSRSSLNTGTEYSFQNAEDAYIRLVPLINNSTPNNFVKLLVETLRLCSHHVPSEHFYHLLFVDEEIPASNRFDNSEMSQLTIEGLKLCKYILKTFKFPGVEVGHFAAGLVKKSNLGTISYDKFVNTFLAIKIISDSTEKAEISLTPKHILSRSMVRCTYFVICKKIFHKYKQNSKSLQSKNDVFLRKSQIGRIMNLLFEDLNQRRLGRRGDSQYYYFGLKWNPNVIDEEMVRLIYREEKMMKSLQEFQKSEQPRKQVFEVHSLVNGLEYTKSVHNSNMVNHSDVVVGEGQSFFGIDSRSSELKYSAQAWKHVPERRSPQFEWINSLLLKSKEGLREFTISLDPLISNFSSQSGDENKGYHEVFELIEILDQRKAPEKAYLYLYIAVILSILRLCLHFDDEFPRKHRAQFQKNMKSFICEMKSKQERSVGWNRKDFFSCLKIIQSIHQIIDLSRLEVKTAAAKDIVAEFVRDMSQTTSVTQPSGETIKNEAILSAVYQTMKAFDVCQCEGASERNSVDEVKRILSIEEPFSKFFTRVEQRIREIPNEMSDEDSRKPMYKLAFHIFVVSVEEFHQECLCNLEVLELPSHSIPSIFFEISNVYLRISFEDFRNRDVELSKQVFKIFWVWAYMMHDYLRIHSEIMVLAGSIID